MFVSLEVNGRPHRIDVEPHWTLLEVLRDRLNLTGTKECCAEGECGACTVILNNRSVNSCLVLCAECEGDRVETIEGVSSHERLDPLQEAFIETGAVQCGFCIPGMIMAARSLLMTTPHPGEDDIKEALSGNLCRCGGYSRIIAAVARAAGKQE
jgi:carbon-monoxide dehydrogenase small subunit